MPNEPNIPLVESIFYLAWPAELSRYSYIRVSHKKGNVGGANVAMIELVQTYFVPSPHSSCYYLLTCSIKHSGYANSLLKCA